MNILCIEFKFFKKNRLVIKIFNLNDFVKIYD